LRRRRRRRFALDPLSDGARRSLGEVSRSTFVAQTRKCLEKLLELADGAPALRADSFVPPEPPTLAFGQLAFDIGRKPRLGPPMVPPRVQSAPNHLHCHEL
jgi:hypothetical protein